jgi:hypothetical protein
MSRIGEILRGAGAKATEEEKLRSNEAAIVAFGEILTHVEPEEIADLVKELAEVAMILRPSGQYEKVDFDGDFTHHKGDIIPVVVWVLREQFGDFFTGVPAIGNLSGRAGPSRTDRSKR